MIDTFFQLQGRPFSAAPRADRYFPGEAAELARQSLVLCVDRAQGPALVIGPAGSGKSMLLHVLAEQFRGQFGIVMLCSARLCSRRALLQAILFELGLPYRDMEEGELRLSLIDHLDPQDTEQGSLLILVDEADVLPLRLLEELRMLTNLVRDGEPRVRLVLAGGPPLEERFASPKLSTFNQRVACRCYLESFNREETAQFVVAQVENVGGNPQLFADEALQAVYSATDGVPRLINQLCDHTLVMAAVGEHRQIDAAIVEDAWADLQQLPAPQRLSETQAAGQSAEIISFGALDDEEDDLSTWDEEVAVVGTVGPEEQLDSVEHQVQEVIDDLDGESTLQPNDLADADFQPAGTIGPEIQIVVEPAHDPFDEEFAEEEVIVTHATFSGGDAWSHGPQVASEEGAALAAVLVNAEQVEPAAETPSANLDQTTASNPLEENPQPPAAEVGEPETTFTVAIDGSEPMAEAPDEQMVVEFVSSTPEVEATNTPDDAPFDPALDPVYPESTSTTVQEAGDLEDEPPGGESVEPAASLTLDDRDLIVITDHLHEQTTTTTVNTAGEAHRQEYRQLFAKLRRG